MFGTVMQNPRYLANAIRALSMDAVELAQSGHPGMPLGMADIAEALWRECLNHAPSTPNFINRDRFVLSNGHGSILLYALLHLSGYQLTIDDIKNFRQLHSKTAGHPELDRHIGIETTTGPLGQGIANAVGMAIAEKSLSEAYNQLQYPLINHYTYCFVGDGCLMEGVSHEACSLAGTLGLGKLITFYDDNGISIDGKVDNWFHEDTKKRFESYDWQVIGPIDGHSRDEILSAIFNAQQDTLRPSLIICKTHIGYGSPHLQDSEKSHGAPFGKKEIEATKNNLNWSFEPFDIPKEIYKAYDALDKGRDLVSTWESMFADYKKTYPEKADEFLRRINGTLPKDLSQTFSELFAHIKADAKDSATRKSSQKVLEHITSLMPELIGGSADLSGSNNTKVKDATTITPGHFNGNYIHYGVREFGMAAIMNGLRLHGGFIPFGGTFLVFSDYAKNAIRLSALMKQKVIYVLSHDSIGLGEDGPTHQPIEHLASLRQIPNVHVWRPADELETAVSWQQSLEYEGPSCICLSRQNLPSVSTHISEEVIAKGGYILKEQGSIPELIIIATGSEVEIALNAYEQLATSHDNIRLISMPCVDIFLNQPKAYQESVLPSACKKRIAIEAGSPDGWFRFVGLEGDVLGISQFGLSAPYKQIYQALGLTSEHLIKRALAL